MRVLALAIAVGLLGAPSSSVADEGVLGEIERRHAELFAAVAPSVVFIATADGFGSGFFVSERGHVLTNRHVVQGVDTVEVVTEGGDRLQGKVVARGGKGTDLAIVKVALEHTPALPLVSSRKVAIGTWVGSVGHGRGGIWTLSTGFVSNVWGSTREHGVLQTQIPLNPGASGGPVFDRHGRVVGIVTAGISDAQAINFAIRSDVAVDKLEYLRSLTDSLTVEAPKGASIQIDGKFAGKGPEVAVLLEPGEHVVSTVVGRRRVKRKVDVPQQRSVTLR